LLLNGFRVSVAAGVAAAVNLTIEKAFLVADAKEGGDVKTTRG
jgi:hypothetical protein